MSGELNSLPNNIGNINKRYFSRGEVSSLRSSFYVYILICTCMYTHTSPKENKRIFEILFSQKDHLDGCGWLHKDFYSLLNDVSSRDRRWSKGETISLQCSPSDIDIFMLIWRQRKDLLRNFVSTIHDRWIRCGWLGGKFQSTSTDMNSDDKVSLVAEELYLSSLLDIYTHSSSVPPVKK